MNCFKYFLTITLAFSLLSGHKQTEAKFSDAVAVVAVAVGVTGFCYLCNKGISNILLYSARNNYKNDYQLLTRLNYEILKKEILIKHEKNFYSRTGHYRNYPLLQYKENLDWYTNSLWFFRILNLFSETGIKMNTMITKLNFIGSAVISDNNFFKERRRFEERLEDRIRL